MKLSMTHTYRLTSKSCLVLFDYSLQNQRFEYRMLTHTSVLFIPFHQTELALFALNTVRERTLLSCFVRFIKLNWLSLHVLPEASRLLQNIHVMSSNDPMLFISSMTHSRKTSARNVDHVTQVGRTVWPVLHFSKLNKMFFGYIDPENIFLDYENK